MDGAAGITVVPAKSATDGGKPGKPENSAKAGTEMPVNPLDVKEKSVSSQDSQFIKSIVTTETRTKEDNILETPPELDPTLLQDIAPPKSILLLILKIIFGFLIFGGLVSLGFFTFQLNNIANTVTSYFGIETPANMMETVNVEVITKKTDVNFYHYLEAKAYLDEFSYYGDAYSKNYDVWISQTASNNEKDEAEGMMESILVSLRESFFKTKDLLVHPFSAPLVEVVQLPDEEINKIFEDALSKRLQNKAEELVQNPNPEAKREYKNYLQTITLIGNTQLKNLLVAADFDALDQQGIHKLIQDVNALVINDLSTIQEIKDQRIKWSDIMKEIEKRTIAVDPQYNDQYYDELGGIRYTSYDFEKEARQISITGETRVVGTTNFTLIANLIDKFNESPFFEDAEMRSFSKSGSLEDGYIASLQLALTLQEGIDVDTESIDLDTMPDFLQEESITR